MRRGGFTLIEGLAASVILAIVALAVCQAVVAAHAQTRHAAHVQRAGMLADDLTERVIAAGYADAPDFDGYSEGPGEARDVAGVAYGEAFAPFARSAVVRDTTLALSVGDPVEGREVEVTVTDHTGRSWVLTRFIPKP